MERRLAAILAADLVGFSRLMGLDEAGTHARIKDLRESFIEPLVAEHRGRVVKLIGDGLLVEFGSVVEALACAVAWQEGVSERERSEPAERRLQFRIGLNLGDVIVDGEDLYGDGVNVAARLESLADPGGIVLSSDAYRQVRRKTTVSLEDMGDTRLKNIAEPVRIYRVHADRRTEPGGAGAAPTALELPTKPSDAEPPGLQARRHLPAPQTPLVGRSAELAELAALLRSGARLVTLTGAGGIGKTRLALQVGHVLAEAFADGVYFVDLAPLTDPGLVPEVIARVLGPGRRREEPPIAAVRAFLSERRILLLLDNFEVVDAAAPLVSDLLRAASGLVVLVTSRTPLRLSGEHQYRVRPLPLADAIQLFAVRARAVAPRFRRPGEEADEVARLCQRLDCLPLAIELAAARTRDYAPRELLESVPGSLELARDGARDLPERQRTLRATIDWSYRLLDPDEQALVARVAVFAGGFTVASAAAVCDASRDTLSSLVGSSLVHERLGTDDAVRFFMLETVREFALELLETSGDADVFRRRHAEHYANLAEAVEHEHPASRSGDAWRGLETEHDNFRAAIDWSRGSGAVELQLRLVGALAYFWATSDHLREGNARIEEALEDADAVPAPLRAKVLAGAALVVHSLGDYERMRAFAEASLELSRLLGDQRRTALALNELGIALSNLGDIDGGIACHEEGAAISRQLTDGIRLTAALNNLGYCLLRRNEPDRARTLFEEGLAVSRQNDHPSAESVLLGNLGLVALLEREPIRALGLFRQALLIDRELEYEEGLIYGLAGIAAALTETGGAPEAALLLGAVRAAAQATAVEFEPLETEIQRQATETLRGTLGLERFKEADATGRQLTLDDAVEHGLSAAAPGDAASSQAPG